ncbi:MAG: hypothetical protein M1828_002122 [Chrysothrix sp. TS-e1954]|nr:MAG: hypothetical protein M1828_002122 [Chrysothrix sp. TS-e1954]
MDLPNTHRHPFTAPSNGVSSTDQSADSTAPSNGTPRSIPLRPGAYAPMLTMFSENEDLDLFTQSKLTLRLAQGGLVGLVVMGSNGEAVHLSRSERSRLLASVRSTLDEGGFAQIPIIAGCTEQSTRGTIELCGEAARDGASYALILPPSYYKPAMTADVLIQHYNDVADKSPIPIMMYNYPGAVAGVDLDSDTMLEIANHPNVVGAKLTCASTGKLMRLAAAAGAVTANSPGNGFLATGGFADIIVQCHASGGSGVIAGTGNVMPKLCARVWDLCAKGEVEKALEMQKVLSRADWALSKGGVGGTKAALQEVAGYGAPVRRPLRGPNEEGKKKIMEQLEEALTIEKGL